jgi:putative nucleotidyltransferase with HDIG domain
MLTGASAIGEATTRARVVRAGLLAGLTAAALAVAIAFIEHDLTYGPLVRRPLAALGGGLLAGILTVGAAPFFEWAFGYMTDISLLELANYEQPLLKDLARLAPGTYHHSIAISTLVEEACEAVGADPLLARVGALHHDVGKTLNAAYFVENQRGKNPHDRGHTPEESARIVMAHVTDGVRLARAQGLPQPVIDFIEQHHGTRAAAYFLEQAHELQRQTGRPFVEADFHYPGPKPQTKETAILMICDVLEARARTLDDREPAAVERMVREVIAGLRDEGQLDECPLTVGDLAKLPGPLAAVLLGMRHERIKYPDQRPAHPRRKKGKRR